MYITHLFIIKIWNVLFYALDQRMYNISIIVACIVGAVLYKIAIDWFWNVMNRTVKYKIWIKEG